ncbi:MAG: hypothetical protein GY796_17820 [Chloroflexi bacterium]|nr:hypothetical protein [Chloroflexota bacterium]
MVEKLRELGHVKLVQLQPQGLIIEDSRTPSGYLYDPSRLHEVIQLTINPLGIETTTDDGEHILDIHHINHPDKEYDDDDLVCIGFTSHYEAMRTRFGAQLVDGIAGENIIIACDKEIWLQDLSQQIIIENCVTGYQMRLEMVSHANPCQEFSQFALGSPYEKPAADKMKATLQFLGNGRRGFLFVMQKGQESATVQAGDKVFVMD